MSGRVPPMSMPGGPSTRRTSRRRVRWLLAVVVVLLLAGAASAWIVLRGSGTSAAAADGTAAAADAMVVVDSTARAPAGAHIRVRVLNATVERGLARRATMMLRDLGYDVVDFDADRKERREHSAILSHTGRGDWALRLQRALGADTIEVSRDSSRYVDFTVLVGRDWKAPAQPLRP